MLKFYKETRSDLKEYNIQFNLRYKKCISSILVKQIANNLYLWPAYDNEPGVKYSEEEIYKELKNTMGLKYE